MAHPWWWPAARRASPPQYPWARPGRLDGGWSPEQGEPLDDGESIVTIKDLSRFAGLLPSEPS
jgi:hypothetical protein